MTEKLYIAYVVRPYTVKIERAVLKAPRIYFFDNMDVNNPEDRILGARFENLVATHLLKRLHFLEESSRDRCGLYCFRDKKSGK